MWLGDRRSLIFRNVFDETHLRDLVRDPVRRDAVGQLTAHTMGRGQASKGKRDMSGPSWLNPEGEDGGGGGLRVAEERPC